MKFRKYSAEMQWCTQEFLSRGGSNSVEDRGQRGRGIGGQ